MKYLLILAAMIVATTVYAPQSAAAPAPAGPIVTKIKPIECENTLTFDQCRIRERIRTEFADYPAFEKTVQCESNFRQYAADGTVLTSPTNDVGITQINLKTWREKAQELGYDIYSEDGNLLMARHVLTVQGITAWVCYNNR